MVIYLFNIAIIPSKEAVCNEMRGIGPFKVLTDSLKSWGKTPIVKDPQAAIPSDRVIRTLKTLSADPANSVWIISGRDQAFLDEWMGHISELGLSAEHGSFMRHPGSDEWENLTEKTDMSWQQEVIDVFQHYTDKTQGGQKV